jgi:hypothetical protein
MAESARARPRPPVQDAKQREAHDTNDEQQQGQGIEADA